MKRETKFRAWDKEKKKMYQVVSLPMTPIEWMTRGMWIKTFDDEELIETKKESNYGLMQFTGLFDKNGKEIYEGDIIKAKVNHGCGFDSWNEEIGVVYWDNDIDVTGKLGWTIKPEEFMGLGYATQGEVIGNIYENPELLK